MINLINAEHSWNYKFHEAEVFPASGSAVDIVDLFIFLLTLFIFFIKMIKSKL